MKDDGPAEEPIKERDHGYGSVHSVVERGWNLQPLNTAAPSE